MYLIECFEAYAAAHPQEGFDIKNADDDIAIVRHSVDTSRRVLQKTGGRSVRQGILLSAPEAYLGRLTSGQQVESLVCSVACQRLCSWPTTLTILKGTRRRIALLKCSHFSCCSAANGFAAGAGGVAGKPLNGFHHAQPNGIGTAQPMDIESGGAPVYAWPADVAVVKVLEIHSVAKISCVIPFLCHLYTVSVVRDCF